jgi:hypothetical protein
MFWSTHWFLSLLVDSYPGIGFSNRVGLLERPRECRPWGAQACQMSVLMQSLLPLKMGAEPAIDAKWVGMLIVSCEVGYYCQQIRFRKKECSPFVKIGFQSNIYYIKQSLFQSTRSGHCLFEWVLGAQAEPLKPEGTRGSCISLIRHN